MPKDFIGDLAIFRNWAAGFQYRQDRFEWIAAFDQDAADNRAFLTQGGKLKMPVLALGGEKSFGPMMATVMRFAANDVREGIVPDSGHWIMEENPAATVKLVRDFLDASK